MTPDYDLSNLATSEADLWIYLQVEAILGQILADQAERLGFPLALRHCTVAALTEEPPARLNSVRPGAGRWFRLRKQD
jgi:hypothetical protein